MSIEFIPINGQNEHLDYEAFEADLKTRLEVTCTDAKVYLYNNFPVVVTEESLIDLLIIIALKDIYGNYFRVKTNSGDIYIKNLIMPVNFIDGFEDQNVIIEDGELLINEVGINYKHEVNGIKYRLQDYLNNKCGFNEPYLDVHPLFFIKNNDEQVIPHHLTAEVFTFNRFEIYLREAFDNNFHSTNRWINAHNYDEYEKVTEDIQVITERASLDSQIGYLTKQKIERIGRKVARSTKMDANLNKSLIIVSGKAGTGKTSELLTLMTKTLAKGNNGLFLTYNKLLVYDLAKSLKAIGDRNKTDIEKFGERKVMTLHQFFYRVSKSLGVLHVMSEDRIAELKDTLRKRLAVLYKFIKLNEQDKHLLSEPEKLLESIQNSPNFNIGTKDLGIDLIRFSRSLHKSFVDSRDEIFKKFFERKESLLEQIATNEIFLADYYGVLQNTLNQIENPENYFEEKGIKDRGKLLNEILNLTDKHYNEENEIIAGAFVEKKNRKIGGFKRARTLFIDEAQDCHYLEKDILVEVFGHENIVVANGGTEQLIRHMELCNWEYSKGTNLNPVKFRTRNKSYRVKKHLLEFCMFVANKYGINLDLEPYEDEEGENPDIGKVIIDFRNNLVDENITDILTSLNENAKVHGCTHYESTLIMIEHVKYAINSVQPETGLVNEHGNITNDILFERDELDLLKNRPSTDQTLSFWDGTRHDKSEHGMPNPDEFRVIFYESCRGLEAWNAMCFSIDKFFDKKYEEEDAEKYLVGDETEVFTADMFLSNEDRKKMYAATWVLMATTRAMDSLYLHVEDQESEFGKTVSEFIKTSPENIKVITDNS